MPPPVLGAPPHRASTAWPPFIRGSVALHVGALGAALAIPGAWPWSLGAVAANHGLITAAGLWPRSTLLGPNLTRLPADSAARGEWAVTIDDGPEPGVTPQVLDQLDAAGARATFFCIAERAQAHPALLRQIVARGHSVQNHSFAHRHDFSLLGPRRMAIDLVHAQQVLGALSGERPRFFRAPAGLRNPFLQPVLARLGLTLASWTRRGFDTRVADPAAVLARLTRGLAAGDIVLLHDGHGARMADGRPVILATLPLLLAAGQRAGLRAVTLPEAVPLPTAAAAARQPTPR